MVFRHLDPPPNRRIGLEKGDLELQDELIKSSPRPSDGDLSDHGGQPEPILAKGLLAGRHRFHARHGIAGFERGFP
jgi:hypothetical protein